MVGQESARARRLARGEVRFPSRAGPQAQPGPARRPRVHRLEGRSPVPQWGTLWENFRRDANFPPPGGDVLTGSTTAFLHLYYIGCLLLVTSFLHLAVRWTSGSKIFGLSPA